MAFFFCITMAVFDKKAHVALAAVALIYGANYIIARDVMVREIIQPNAFILLRVVAATLLFFILHKRYDGFSKQDHIRMVLCGLTGVATNQLLFFNGLKLSGPIQSALIMTTTPVLVYLIAVVIGRSKFLWHKIFGISLGMLGAGLIIWQKDIGNFEHAWLGNIMVFINASSYAVYLIIAQSLMTKHPPVQVLKYVFAYGLLFVIPFALPSVAATKFHEIGYGESLSILYVLLFTTYLAYRLNGFALGRVNATVVSIYLYLQPVVATLLSLFLAVEGLSMKKMIAAGLILVSILLVSREKLGR